MELIVSLTATVISLTKLSLRLIPKYGHALDMCTNKSNTDYAQVVQKHKLLNRTWLTKNL